MMPVQEQIIWQQYQDVLDGAIVALLKAKQPIGKEAILAIENLPFPEIVCWYGFPPLNLNDYIHYAELLTIKDDFYLTERLEATDVYRSIGQIGIKQSILSDKYIEDLRALHDVLHHNGDVFSYIGELGQYYHGNARDLIADSLMHISQERYLPLEVRLPSRAIKSLKDAAEDLGFGFYMASHIMDGPVLADFSSAAIAIADAVELRDARKDYHARFRE